MSNDLRSQISEVLSAYIEEFDPYGDDKRRDEAVDRIMPLIEATLQEKDREIERLATLVETYQQQNDGLTNGVVRAAGLLANRRHNP